MTEHRSHIENLAAEFESHVNKGALKRAAAILPDLVHKLLDMVEHHAGVKANKGTVTKEANARAAADTELAEKIEEVVAKVEDNTAAIAEVKEEAPAPAEDEKTVLVEETPAAEETAEDADKKPAKGKKKAD